MRSAFFSVGLLALALVAAVNSTTNSTQLWTQWTNFLTNLWHSIGASVASAIEGLFTSAYNSHNSLAAVKSQVREGSYLFQWTNFFTSLWNTIWNAIMGFFGSNSGKSGVNVTQQFLNQVSELQSNASTLKGVYVNTVNQYGVKYNFTVNQSWTIQVNDVNATTNKTIGRLTITWNGIGKNVSIVLGKANSTVSPTYAVLIDHSVFQTISQDVIHSNLLRTLADYTTSVATRSLRYWRVS